MGGLVGVNGGVSRPFVLERCARTLGVHQWTVWCTPSVPWGDLSLLPLELRRSFAEIFYLVRFELDETIRWLWPKGRLNKQTLIAQFPA